MNNKKEIENAVIYCRVSSKKQKDEGHGLDSQETRCREYARFKDYKVTEVFTDDITGKLETRPGIKAMLSYLRQFRGEGYAVIIDDISRLARNVEAHIKLRAAIASVGGKLESPSIEFGDDSDSILVENLLASVSQHQREKNGEQVVNRMRARTMNGYWTFQKPKGYKYVQTKGEGKILVRDEPVASIVQEALEGFAHGRFQTQAEFKRFLESHPLFPKDLPNGELRPQTIVRILTKSLYAGYLEVPNWNISLRKAKHPGLIDLATYEKIQERLNSKAQAPARKDLNEDFPLRGFVTCGDCDAPLKSCWSKGKYKRYPYYLCQTKSCASYGKSIPRDKLEGEFETVLHGLAPAKSLFAHVKALFYDARDQHITQTKAAGTHMKVELRKLDKQIGQLLDRIVEATSSSVIAAYERRIETLEKDKLLLQEKLAEKPVPERTYDDILELSLSFLANPWKLWHSEQFEHKRAVLKLAFAERLAYCRNQGYRTPKTTLPFKVLKSLSADGKRPESTGNKGVQGLSPLAAPSSTASTLDPSLLQFGKMVPQERLELPT
ncbi:MAG: recombinase [Alphaproteobacteria bacterium]|nr:recombinase [Alphaproteobacteria bacterium]